MDQAMQTLLDKQAIYELSCRYMRGLDRLDADALHELVRRHALQSHLAKASGR